jgi:hypothetical protein
MAVGAWDVDGMLRSRSARQLMEWLRFAELEPFGPEREDYRTGAVVNVMANAHRNPKRRPFTIEETTPRFGDSRATKPPTRATPWQAMRGLAQALVTENRSQRQERKVG